MSGSTPARRRLSRGQYGLDVNGHSPFIPRTVMSGIGTSEHDGEGVTVLYGGRPFSVRLTLRRSFGGKRDILTALASGWERGMAVVQPGRNRWPRYGGIPLSAAPPGNPGNMMPGRQARVSRAIHVLDHSSLFRASAGSASRTGHVPWTRSWIGERISAIRDGIDGQRTGGGK